MTDLAQHLKATFLSLLPADGATKGNGALRREIEEQLSKDGLSITEEQYWQVHAELIASGVVATGKGRGGSVRLVDAQPDSFGLATQVVEAEEIELFFLPAYAPELNPDEYLNCDLKHQVRTGLPARNQDELERRVRSVMRRLQLHPERSVLISGIHVSPTQHDSGYLIAGLIAFRSRRQRGCIHIFRLFLKSTALVVLQSAQAAEPAKPLQPAANNARMPA